ncbi:MAG: L-aspartate oxidase [Proteobacteria bacterium]|nr:L-aspartate oxidase [Pseudomonadota bacterium]
MIERVRHDGVLVVGGGLAGLSAALPCAPRPTLVLSAEPLGGGASSAWAQGGIAAAVGAEDSPALHARDTVAAGAGLIDADRALALTELGPGVVERLSALGVRFDRDETRYHLSLEAAHSRPRVVRVGGDGAGCAILAAVGAAALAAPHIQVRTGFHARALLQDAAGRVRGILADQAGRPVEITASATILATGGLGGLYAVTTNPRALRGDGLAMAALAGAAVLDPEFVQFHPTAIDLGLDPAPLATEALRGEGAVLIDGAGRPIMPGVHPDGDLAPRDVVARALHGAVADGRGAFLDARRAIGSRFPAAYPAVFAACMSAGLDPRAEPIPVAPAAHFHMGGIEIDADGRTSLAGLFAAGECAAAGVHGANRLASNSLLEAAGFGAATGQAAATEADPGASALPLSSSPELPEADVQRLRAAMTRHAGVVRDAPGLRRLLTAIDELDARHPDALPLVAARMIAESALAREESRGAHHRLDFPARAEPAQHSRLFLPYRAAIAA